MKFIAGMISKVSVRTLFIIFGLLVGSCTALPIVERFLERLVNEQSIFSFGADRTLDVFSGPDGAGGAKLACTFDSIIT